jgi:hypothetical protein
VFLIDWIPQLVRSCISHISLIRTPMWTFHIWILIYSMRPIQWWSPNCILWSLTTPIWPVGPTGLTDQTRHANFGCEPPCFLVKLVCQKNIHKYQNWLKTMIKNASPIFFAPKGNNYFIGHKIAPNSWNNLFWSPYLLSSCWPCRYHHCLLFHWSLLSHSLQSF